MNKYIIERTIPGAGNLSRDEVSRITEKSLAVLRELGPDVQWVESYVTGDKLFCVYNATTPELVREHARRAGFPIDTVLEVRRKIDPAMMADR